MNKTKEKPFFRKETDLFVLYKPAPLHKMRAGGSEVVGKYRTWQEAQMESLRHFGRKAAKII